MEFAPRALQPARRDQPIAGRSSITASSTARLTTVRPGVHAEYADQWFAGSKHMVLAYTAKADPRRIPAVIHQDGTAQVQLVWREANPRYNNLTLPFYARTGAALVHRSMTASPPYAHHRHVPWCWHRCPFMGDICLTSRIEQNAITASPDRRLDFSCCPLFGVACASAESLSMKTCGRKCASVAIGRWLTSTPNTMPFSSSSAV